MAEVEIPDEAVAAIEQQLDEIAAILRMGSGATVSRRDAAERIAAHAARPIGRAYEIDRLELLAYEAQGGIPGVGDAGPVCEWLLARARELREGL